MPRARWKPAEVSPNILIPTILPLIPLNFSSTFHSFAEECKALEVDLVSLKQNIDTTLPAGRLTFQVFGAVAEFEREMLPERVKAGMNQNRRIGRHIGRPARRRLGRAEIEKTRLLRSQGRSVRRLAKEFGGFPVG